MKRTKLYVLYNPLTNNWVTPTWTDPNLPFVSMCTGFIDSDTPFFTDLDAWKILLQTDAPGIELIELRVAEVFLLPQRRIPTNSERSSTDKKDLLQECYTALNLWRINWYEKGDPTLDLLQERTDELIERLINEADLPKILNLDNYK